MNGGFSPLEGFMNETDYNSYALVLFNDKIRVLKFL